MRYSIVYCMYFDCYDPCIFGDIHIPIFSVKCCPDGVFEQAGCDGVQLVLGWVFLQFSELDADNRCSIAVLSHALLSNGLA